MRAALVFVLGFISFPTLFFLIGLIEGWLDETHALGFGERRVLFYFPDGVRMEKVDEARALGNRVVQVFPRVWWFKLERLSLKGEMLVTPDHCRLCGKPRRHEPKKLPRKVNYVCRGCVKR